MPTWKRKGSCGNFSTNGKWLRQQRLGPCFLTGGSILHAEVVWIIVTYMLVSKAKPGFWFLVQGTFWLIRMLRPPPGGCFCRQNFLDWHLGELDRSGCCNETKQLGSSRDLSLIGGNSGDARLLGWSRQISLLAVIMVNAQVPPEEWSDALGLRRMTSGDSAFMYWLTTDKFCKRRGSVSLSSCTCHRMYLHSPRRASCASELYYITWLL